MLRRTSTRNLKKLLNHNSVFRNTTDMPVVNDLISLEILAITAISGASGEEQQVSRSFHASSGPLYQLSPNTHANWLRGPTHDSAAVNQAIVRALQVVGANSTR